MRNITIKKIDYLITSNKYSPRVSEYFLKYKKLNTNNNLGLKVFDSIQLQLPKFQY